MSTTVMTPGGRQQQTQPTVVVVQQPVVMNGRGKVAPYLLRGARFANGCTVSGRGIIILITLGGILSTLCLSAGAVSALTASFIWIPFLFLGAGLLVPGIWLCVTAKRQFKALPPDHPHRLKYGKGYRIPVTSFNNTTTYAFRAAPVTGSAISAAGPIAGYQASTARQPSGYPVQAAGQTYVYPCSAAGQSGHAMPAGGQTGSHRTGEPGTSSALPTGQDPNMYPFAPPLQPAVNDPPPAYSEIMKL